VNDAQARLDALLSQAAMTAPRFPANSRYATVPTTALVRSDGRAIVYLRRRFVPPPEQLSVLREHIVVQGDRLDNLAAAHLGDPELAWQLCDANRAMRPDDLTESIGRRLRITLPSGIQGTSDGR